MSLLCNTEEDTDRELAVLESLEEKRVDGVLLCSPRLAESQLEAVTARHSAVVLVNRRLDSGNVGVVMIDDEKAARVAAQHLLQTSREAIGFLAGPLASHSGHQRARGHRAALATERLRYYPGWTRPCSPTVEGGRETARELLNTRPELTALLCYNDLVAVGVLLNCAELGHRVPEDIAVVGCDDIPLATLIMPSLTTSRGPRYELGRQAMELLLSRINGCSDEVGQDACAEIVLQPELIVRASAP
jgi:LacI family transcriptional regulator